MIAAGPSIAWAQAAPDAGALQKQIEQQQLQNRFPQKAERRPIPPPPPPLKSLGRATVIIRTFHFTGNTLLTVEQLADAVTSFTDRPISFIDLQDAAVAAAEAYRKKGWIVRAYLPQQQITDDAVTIHIVEAQFGSVRMETESKRISARRLTRAVESSQTHGEPVSSDALDRALLLIDDLPGIRATGRLIEGQGRAETDLLLAVVDAPLMTYDMSADNAGARSTGAARFVVNTSLNSPFRLGDRASALLLHSRGGDYARGAYSLPVGDRGARIGVNTSHFAYDIVTAEFEALAASGTSTSGGVEASYPLLRARARNLYVVFTGDDRRFENKTLGQVTTQYSVQAVSFGIYGNLFDAFAGGGSNSASATLTQGKVNLDGSPSEAADALTTRIAGSYRKLNFSIARQQAVTRHLSAYASLSGQMASKNLDSSEKFYLGGSSGVRAYPTNEGGGSQGLLASLEARVRLPASFNATGFVDWGSVRINKDNDFAGAAALNQDSLKGAGFSVGWKSAFGLSLQLAVAHRIGSNPIPASTGKDQDGSLDKNRYWLQGSLQPGNY